MKVTLRIVCVLLAVSLLLTACTGGKSSLQDSGEGQSYTLEQEMLGISITAEQSGEYGIETDTTFLIDTPGGVSTGKLQERLTISPETPFRVEKAGQNQARLIPEQPLAGNAVYVVALLSQTGAEVQTWAFQTKPEFFIHSTTPHPDSDYVETDTGVEVVFSYGRIDLDGYFTISPDVAGTFQSQNGRSAFVPSERLELNTTYTVTIDGSLSAPDGTQLGEDCVFSFKTSPSPPYEADKDLLEYYLTGEPQETFLPDDVPVIELFSYNEGASQPFTVDVYALTGTQYLSELRAHNRWQYDRTFQGDPYQTNLEGKTPLTSFSAPLMRVTTPYGDSNWYEKYIVFPDTLEAGCYVAEVSATDAKTGEVIKRQKLMQVNDLSVYLQSVNGDALLWLNDTRTGEAAAGVRADLLLAWEEQALDGAETAQDGTARLSTGDEELAVLHITCDDAPDYWDLVKLSPQMPQTPAERYTSFLFVDRAMYQPTDTVQFGGVIRGRYEAVPAGEQFTVTLNEGYAYDWDSQQGETAEDALQSVAITAMPDGTFTGSISYERLKNDTYHLNIYNSEGVLLKQENFEVTEYEKPEYDVRAFSEKSYYLPGEQIDMNAEVKFFDGTPVWGFGLDYYAPFNYGEPTLYTDRNGIASATVTVEETASWHPERIYYQFYNASGERYEYTFTGGAIHFASNVLLQAELEGQGQNAAINIRTNELDVSRIKTPEDIYENYPQSFTGRAVDTAVQVDITKIEQVRELAGTYYDWAAKKNVEMFRYNYVESQYAQYTRSTQNGQLTLHDLPVPVSGTYYRVTLSADNGAGGRVTEEVYITSGRLYWMDEMGNIKYYQLAPRDPEPERYYYSADYASFSGKVGEEIEFYLDCNGRATENAGTILVTTIQDKILTTQFTHDTQIAVSHTQDTIPNFRLWGAYFDGRYVYPVAGPQITYDFADEELDVTITAEQERYLPGEDANITVQVRDKNGAPVQASIILSVVDEAMYALAEQPLTPLEDLYAKCYDYAVVTHQSHTQHRFFDFGSGGMGGGDGGVDIRSSFPDTAAFIRLESDADGMASTTVTLPDSITSWRLTGAAFDSTALRAGVSSRNLSVTLPMFAQPVYSETYLTGDDIAMTVRAFGAAMDYSVPVRYRMEITPDDAGVKGDYPLVQERKGRSNLHTNFNFGKLPAGNYTFTLYASTNGYADAVSHSFEVVNATLEIPVIRQATLDENGLTLSAQPSRYPVIAGFADERYGSYFEAANRILYGYGGRADQSVAAIAASRSMRRFMDEASAKQLDVLDGDLSGFNGYEYNFGMDLLALYAYDSGDVILTAKAIALLGDDIENAEQYTQNLRQLEDMAEYFTIEERCAALMALAAQKEPVLTEIRTWLKTPEHLSAESRTYLCAGLGLLGDTQGAQEVYDTLIAPEVKTAGSYKQYAPESYDAAETYRLTALALMAASAAQHTDAQALCDYVLQDTGRVDYDPCLELAFYVKCLRPAEGTTASVSYSKNGKRQTVSLEQNAIHYVSLMEDDLAQPVQAQGGAVSATLFYIGTAADISGETSPDTNTTDAVQLSKTVRTPTAQDIKGASGITSLGASGLPDFYAVDLTVTFADDAPQGSYVISERVPTALRYNSFSDNWVVSRENYDEEPNSPYLPDSYSPVWMERNGQSLRFNFYHTQDDPKSVTITYLARRVYEGDFQQEDVYLLHTESGLAVIGDTDEQTQSFRRETAGKRKYAQPQGGAE